METDKIGRDADGWPVLVRGRRYTPREFAERIWAARTFEELKSEVCGFGVGEGLGLEDQGGRDWGADGKVMSRGWTAIGISMPRGNKPLTLEFRQHQGTTDFVVISWWVKFLGKLIRYAHFLCKDVNYQLKDQGILHPTEAGFLDHWSKNNSILDLLSFPQEGKEHFQRLAKHHKNDEFDAKRAIERTVIQNRIARTKLGGSTGEEMDSNIRKLSWYKNTTIKNPELDVLPPPKVWSRYSWPNTPHDVVRFLIWEVTRDDEGSPGSYKLWLEDRKKFKELLRLDGSGRIWLWKRIMDEQRRKGEMWSAEVIQPSDSDTKIEDV
jgi:hypothetical protein